MNMSHTLRQNLIRVLMLLFLAASPLLLAAPKTEAELIAELASPKESKVTDALLKLEKQFPASTNAFATIKPLLKDPRPKVRRKAARVLGALHAELDEAHIKDICALLKSTDVDEITDGLKALRGLKAPSAVAEVKPFLKHANTHLIRDACRTLAVLGNKDLIPDIQPLLSHAQPAVQKDALDAINTLRSKS